ERFRILDYGCGDGQFVALVRLFGWEAYGLDFSCTRMRQGEDVGVNIYGELETLHRAAPLPMHAVTLFQVLEHVSEPGAILGELARHMLNGGILVVEVPDCEGINIPLSMREFLLLHPLEHINVFTSPSLAAICGAHGFERMERLPAHVTA